MAIAARVFDEVYDGKYDEEIYGDAYSSDSSSLPTETTGSVDKDGNNIPPAAVGSRYISAAGEAYVLFPSGWASL